MTWPLVIVGFAMGMSLILIKVRSPMLFAVGMYLPLETTFAIFAGGLIRGIADRIVKARREPRTLTAGPRSERGRTSLLAAPRPDRRRR